MTSERFDQQGSLMVRTRALIKSSGKTLLDIRDETGLPFYWLRKFAAGEIKNPSVNRVQFLYEHLTSAKLLAA